MFYVGTCYRIGEDKDENGGKDSGDREKTIDLFYLEAVLLQRIVVQVCKGHLLFRNYYLLNFQILISNFEVFNTHTLLTRKEIT